MKKLLALLLTFALFAVWGCAAAPDEGTPLTDAELQEFQLLFADPGYPAFNGYNAVLGAPAFDSPENVDWSQFFYDGTGEGEAALTEEERAFCEQNNVALNMSVYRLSTEQMNTLAEQYFGIVLSQSNRVGLEDVCYFAETDSYYIYHGDTHITHDFAFQSGTRLEDGSIRLHYEKEFVGEMVLTLLPNADQTGYVIQSNQLLES